MQEDDPSQHGRHVAGNHQKKELSVPNVEEVGDAFSGREVVLRVRPRFKRPLVGKHYTAPHWLACGWQRADDSRLPCAQPNASWEDGVPACESPEAVTRGLVVIGAVRASRAHPRRNDLFSTTLQFDIGWTKDRRSCLGSGVH